MFVHALFDVVLNITSGKENANEYIYNIKLNNRILKINTFLGMWKEKLKL